MNTFKKVLNASFAAVLLSLTSCVSDDFLAVTEPETQNEGNPLTLTVTQGNPSGTRLALKSDGLTTEWELGDQLVLIDKARLRDPIYLNCTLTSSDTKATFVSDGGVPADDYWVIYNFDEYNYNTYKRLSYGSHSLSTISQINQAKQMVLYGELTIKQGDTSAQITLKQLYAKINVKLKNVPTSKNNTYKIGMYAYRKGFSGTKTFTQNGLVDGEDIIHNSIIGTVDVTQIDEYSALLLPTDLSSTEVFFYLLSTDENGNSICYEIMKNSGKMKLESGLSYNIVLDMDAATTSTIERNNQCTTMLDISSPEEWRHAVYLNEPEYRIKNDIDFTGKYFIPINNIIRIHGNGMTLRNIKLERDEDNVGLCNSAMGIDNLTLENVQFEGRNYVGAFGGSDVMYINNCKLTGTSKISGSGDYVGGIVGLGGMQLTNVSIEKGCSVEGVNYVGGIVGACQHGNTSLKSCVSYATVTSKTGDYVGGIFGKIGGDETYNYTDLGERTYIIEKCQNSGNVTGVGCVGGIGGEFACVTSVYQNENNVALIKSFSDGIVSGVTSVGGILGCTWGAVNTCYSTNNIQGENYVGGIVGTVGGIGDIHVAAHIRNCYSLSNIKASSNGGGIVGLAPWRGPVWGGCTYVENCYYAGTTNSGIIGHSDGGCCVENCLTTSTHLGANLGEHIFNDMIISDFVTNSEFGITSIKEHVGVINGDNAYSTTDVWLDYSHDCVKFATSLDLGTDAPGFGSGGDI